MRGRARFSLLALIVALLSCALVAAGCGDDEDEGGGESAGGAEIETIEPGVLTVGSDIPFPPFEKGRAPNYEGYDIDIVNEVAERTGLEVQIEDTAFDTIFRDLAQGKFDMVASATTILPEREQAVDFSDPYYFADQALMVEEGNNDIQTVDDLGEATVGAQDGTTGEIYANDETDAAEVRGFPEGPDAINALRAGTVDAVIIDLPVAEDAVEVQGGVEVAQRVVTREEYGLAFQESGDALREEANAALQGIKDDGTFADIYQQWFKEQPPEELLSATHEPE